METILYYIKKCMPTSILKLIRPPYHFALATLGALRYRFPSKEITVIGVTGTKGKSSVTEIINTIFEEDGRRTAVLNTLRFKTGEKTERNMRKMTMPGRFFVQKFLREAVDGGCELAIIEMTSEGVKQFRHRYIDLDALVFTNLSPEHIESHGSYEKYVQAKLKIGHALERSNKKPRRIIANTDDAEGAKFLTLDVEEKIPYGLDDVELYNLNKESVSMVLGGTTIHAPLIGLFNLYNILAAIAVTSAFGVPQKTIIQALGNLKQIRGRVETIHAPQGAHKHITAVVDYAHTPDSLEKLYQAFRKEHKVCVLGNTGGGRDTWKRPEMGKIAASYCDRVILTNEDPYDEDPDKIIDDMIRGIEDENKVEVIMDRRLAIRRAIEVAPEGATILISGKGTDPYIMGPNNTRTPWDDAKVTRREIEELLTSPQRQVKQKTSTPKITHGGKR